MRSADSAPAAAASDAPIAGPVPDGKMSAHVTAVAACLTLTAVSLAHPSATRLHTWPWALVGAALWLLPVAWLALRIGRDPSFRLPAPVLTAGLGLLAASAVISAWLSPFSAASLAATWPTLGGVSLCFLLHAWLTAPSTVRSRSAVEILATALALVGAAVVVASLVIWWRNGATSRNAAPFGHSTYTGGAMVLLVPWFAAQAWTSRAAPRAAWLLMLLASLIVVASTSSRGAVAALGLVIGAGAVAALFATHWPRGRKALLLVAALALVALAILANPRLRELVVERRWGDAARESNRQRAAMADAGLRLGAERPFLGWGPGSVPLAYPKIRAELEGGVDNVLQLHNTPLQIWATLGLAGSAALLLLAAGSLQALARARAAANIALAPQTVAAAASLGGYALFSLTDHQFDLPLVATLAAANLAVLSSAANAIPVRPFALAGSARWIGLVALLALTVGPAVWRTRDLRARAAFEGGLVARENHRPADYLAALDRASGFAPHDPFFAHQAAAALLRAAESATDAAARQELTRAAVTRLERSLGTGVHQEFAHFNLGWLKLDAGDPAAAARHFVAAARLVPDKGGVYFGLGLALLAAGRMDDAVRACALEWLNDPRQATSPAWEVPALAELRPRIYAEVLARFAELRARHPPAATAEAWTRWWHGEIVAPETLAGGFSREAADFAVALPLIESRAALPAQNTPWARLYAAWRDREFAALASAEPAFPAALAQRARGHRADFRLFLAGPIGDEPALMRTFRRQRTGYGVLASHPDGPLLTDVYIVQENRLVADYAANLFPPKGWLPGRFLLAWLPALGSPDGPSDPR